ncbi:hypothetical protein D3C85_1751180 [compost metagenome]
MPLTRAISRYVAWSSSGWHSSANTIRCELGLPLMRTAGRTTLSGGVWPMTKTNNSGASRKVLPAVSRNWSPISRHCPASAGVR